MDIVFDLCDHQLFPRDLQGPAEYCPEQAEPGSAFCYDHDPARGEPDWDDIRKDRLVGYDCE